MIFYNTNNCLKGLYTSLIKIIFLFNFIIYLAKSPSPPSSDRPNWTVFVSYGSWKKIYKKESKYWHATKHRHAFKTQTLPVKMTELYYIIWNRALSSYPTITAKFLDHFLRSSRNVCKIPNVWKYFVVEVFLGVGEENTCNVGLLLSAVSEWVS